MQLKRESEVLYGGDFKVDVATGTDLDAFVAAEELGFESPDVDSEQTRMSKGKDKDEGAGTDSDSELGTNSDEGAEERVEMVARGFDASDLASDIEPREDVTALLASMEIGNLEL
jgi:hypothetical protein